ncbi:MAG TPA: TIGR03032 family protein, partial [Planctomycetaceae bacterium]|nr:TIGR03032 family protein [Planctomycetaceae bacterium]
VAWLRFEDAVQEVFAVSVIPNRTWPDLINDDPELIGFSYVLPDEALKDVPDDMRSTS